MHILLLFSLALSQQYEPFEMIDSIAKYIRVSMFGYNKCAYNVNNIIYPDVLTSLSYEYLYYMHESSECSKHNFGCKDEVAQRAEFIFAYYYDSPELHMPYHGYIHEQPCQLVSAVPNRRCIQKWYTILFDFFECSNEPPYLNMTNSVLKKLKQLGLPVLAHYLRRINDFQHNQ
jgi:hypothetical protein